MTLYQVDRVVYEVGREDEDLEAFVKDPQAYLAGMDLEDHERDALAKCDVEALWSMGAHPFILFGFVRRVLTARGHPEPGQIAEEYKARIAPLGRPSYAT